MERERDDADDLDPYSLELVGLVSDMFPSKFSERAVAEQFLHNYQDSQVIGTIGEQYSRVQKALVGQNDWQSSMMREFGTLEELREFIHPLVHGV